MISWSLEGSLRELRVRSPACGPRTGSSTLKKANVKKAAALDETAEDKAVALEAAAREKAVALEAAARKRRRPSSRRRRRIRRRRWTWRLQHSDATVTLTQ